MTFTYKEARQWIHSRLQFGIKPGLDRMKWMLEQLGNPEQKSKYIHIGGTNGKGSTLTYLRNVLQESNYTVGSFTSPYIVHFNERISVNGLMITDDEWITLVEKIKPVAERLEKETEYGVLTEFESITVMMFYYFGEINPVDIVLLEVGLGGRYDSTNMIAPLLSIITNVGHDHMAILGNRIEAIANEKAGIIKKNTPIVTAVENENAIEVIEEEAYDQDAPFYMLNRQFEVISEGNGASGERFTYVGKHVRLEGLEIKMKGLHQLKNAAVALMSVEILREQGVFTIQDEHIYKGLKKAHWNGRFEIISTNPTIILDGAHNEEGVAALVDTVNRYYKDIPKTIVTSMMKDKDVSKMIEMLDSISDKMIFTSFDFPRAMDAEVLAGYSEHSNKRVVDDFKEVIHDEELIIYTGSLYFISEVRKTLC